MSVASSSTLGRFAIVCRWDETKMGALPPGMDGRLGIGKEFVSSSIMSSSGSSVPT